MAERLYRVFNRRRLPEDEDGPKGGESFEETMGEYFPDLKKTEAGHCEAGLHQAHLRGSSPLPTGPDIPQDVITRTLSLNTHSFLLKQRWSFLFSDEECGRPGWAGLPEVSLSRVVDLSLHLWLESPEKWK